MITVTTPKEPLQVSVTKYNLISFVHYILSCVTPL